MFMQIENALLMKLAELEQERQARAADAAHAAALQEKLREVTASA